MEPGDRIDWIVLSGDQRARLRSAAAEVLPRHAWVRAAWLHGSATEPGRAARDLDVGLLADPDPEPAMEAAVARELAGACGLDAGAFDLRTVNRADPVFLGRMLSGGVLLYQADRDQRAAFEAAAISRWLDFRPAFERVRAEVLRRWAAGE